MKGIVVIDGYKLEIFKKHLTEAGYQFEVEQGPFEGTLGLAIEVTDPQATADILKIANDAAELEMLETIKKGMH